VHIGINAHLLSLASSYRQAGVSRYIAELVRHLAAEPGPHTYTIFTPPHGVGDLVLPPSMRVAASRLPTEQPAVRIVWEQMVGPVLATARRLDLVHAPVNVAPLALAGRTVITIHDLAFLVYPERFRPGRRRYLALMTRLSARRAARVIAVSAHTARDVVDRLGVAPGRVVVVPEAAAEHFRPEPDARRLADFRAAHNLPEQYILFVGTLEPRKNIAGLLRAFARVAAAEPGVRLVVVGGRGWFYDEVFALHEALGLRERVHFAGYAAAEDLPRWYQAATAFVYPSFYEGFGLPVLEAMACGTPVITSNVSSLPEVVGPAGVTLDPHDEPALAAAVLALIRDPARRTHLRAAGLARAATFSWARMARETRAVYESLTPASMDRRHAPVSR
jgi:glycosyltransferase involved in cell wall biosynthesis